MIEYANEAVIKLLKQYDMLSKSLNFTMDLKQKNDICYQMTKIIQSVIEITNSIYEEKYTRVEKRSVYLMDEEKTRLLELINLINERRAYVNNQVINNKELTGISLDMGTVLGEEKLEEYKSQVKIIDKYKNNIRLEGVLKEEIQALDTAIKKANVKINNNKNLNKQLEDKMIRLLEKAFEKLSLFELQEREKEIDLAYTELGYSLEKAKENAIIARRDCTEEIILECDNMLASITLEYERYKEKKLILKLIRIYKKEVENYEDLLAKREEINTILMNITNSDLYSMVGPELNKEYATIKLEGQDVATLKSLMEEKEVKGQNLKEIIGENNSEEFKGLLANLLENEKKYQEKLQQEKKRKEQEKLERQRIEAQKKQEEIAKRQKAIEEERKKEIERRTKQLLVEKQNPILMSTREGKNKEELLSKSTKEPQIETKRKREVTPQTHNLTATTRTENRTERRYSERQAAKRTQSDWQQPSANIFPSTPKEDFFTREARNTKVVDQGIPIIKNNNLDNHVISAKKVEEKEDKLFPNIPLDKKESIFPDLPDMNKNNSFFDENELNDLSDYMEDSKKKSWF